MIYVDTYGGLCNRMRAIVSAVNICKRYNAQVEILWHLNKSLNCHFYDLFTLTDFSGKVLETKYKYNPSFILKKYSSHQFIGCKRDSESEIEQLIKREKNVYIRTPHQFSDVGNFEIFHPTKAIELKANELMQDKTNVIGIHIRRTDNVKSIANSPTELFILRMEEELEKDSSLMFYLATDNTEEKVTLSEYFPGRIITQKDIELSRDSSDGILSACVDLVCLSKCKKILGSYWSSFSEVASLWNKDKPLEIVSKE